MQKLQFSWVTRSNLPLYLNIFLPVAVISSFAIIMWLLILNSGLNFDEGYNLQVPVNLLRNGIYGSRTLSGFTIFDPFISSGPAFLLPITFIFRIFGISVINARIVCLLVAIITITGLYVFNRMLRNTMATILGLGLLFCVQASLLRFISILGDGLGICLVIAGLIVWAIAEKKKSTGYAFTAGLLLGTSVWAKPSMVIAVSVIVLAILIAFVRPQYPLLLRIFFVFSLTAFAVSAAWFTLSILMTWHTGSIFSGSASRLIEEQLNFEFIKNIRNNLPMTYKTIGLAVILTSIINLLQNRRNKDFSSARMASNLLPLIWIIWWFLFNRYTVDRHLYPGLIFGIIPITQFFIYPAVNKYSNLLKVIIAIILAIGALPAIKDTGNYLSHLDQKYSIKVDQEQMADYVAKLPPDAQIMGWDWFMDWDIAFLSQRVFGDLSTETIVPIEDSIFIMVTLTMKNAGILDQNILPIVNQCAGTLIYKQGGYELYEIKGLCKLK